MASRRELVGALAALLRRIDYAESIDDLREGAVLTNAMRVLESSLAGDIKPAAWKPLVPVPYGTVSEAQIASAAKGSGSTIEETREAFLRISQEDTLWINHTYQVSRREMGDEGVHLSIKRIDQEAIHDWRDLQRIKNQLLGEECEAVELYPAESRMVDSANQFHLWGSSDPSFRFGFGFEERLVSNDDDGAHGQRSL